MLRKYYLENLEKVQEQFIVSEDPQHVVLFDFFSNSFYKEFSTAILNIKCTKHKELLAHIYSTGKLPVGILEAINSPEFLDYISLIIEKSIKQVSGEIFSFSHKDYTILNDKHIEKPGFDIIIDCTPDWDVSWGGSIIYVDGSGDYTRIPIKGNTLSIVQREQGIQRFVKYVNNKAKKKRRVFVKLSFP